MKMGDHSLRPCSRFASAARSHLAQPGGCLHSGGCTVRRVDQTGDIRNYGQSLIPTDDCCRGQMTKLGSSSEAWVTMLDGRILGRVLGFSIFVAVAALVYSAFQEGAEPASSWAS